MSRWLGILLVVLGLLADARAAEPEMHLSPKKVRDEVKTVVAAQLAALQSSDFAGAYEHAAAGIRRQFDVRVFALMIKRGYAPLLHQEKTDFGLVHDNGAGIANVVVTVSDHLNRVTLYRYWLVQEDGWKISGVTLEQKPPHGDI